jgi:hypothetical protein
MEGKEAECNPPYQMGIKGVVPYMYQLKRKWMDNGNALE